MAWHDESKIIGEKVVAKNEKETGVITRIDYDRKLVYVLFKKLREVAYPYPESFEQGFLVVKYRSR